MFKKSWIVAGFALAWSVPLAAKVTPEEAQRLKSTLTPVGADRAGSAEGVIPEWTGGLTTPPAAYGGRKANARLVDPFADDKPSFVITAQNAAQYRDMLSAGQMAMLERHPASYRLPVYPTRRSAAAPKFFYDASYRNALEAELDGGGEALRNAITGVAFPLPKNGHEVMWNHKTRYRGLGARRWNNQFALTPSGGYTLTKIQEDVKFVYNQPNIKPADLANVMVYFLSIVREPKRLAGTVTLVHDTLDQIKEPRRAWQFNPGQRRLRRAPNVGYDNPAIGADGLRTNDQLDMFNGATDRYTWKLVGKREMFIPYNAYKVHSAQSKYKDIVKPKHVEQDLTRYERHRVWVVDSVTKPGTSHLYKRRVYYVDEDSWQIVLIDIYDRRDKLWRFQEAHTILYYDPRDPLIGSAMETIYDLQNNRYLVMALNNEDAETTYGQTWDNAYFNPSSVADLVK